MAFFNLHLEKGLLEVPRCLTHRQYVLLPRELLRQLLERKSFST